ncbi:esterase-like activity of phytase family protein [Flexibacterium corallicola]|uniref:esterase-like activity of phytase family protein n=1 Tax=Flexibacterium corallicola TaxID=3037259 RepID=UPI00286F2140|nr:esterase-like activity of phytase family protein [Pseudovibrio sp. M1P-2-3]
MRKQYITLSSAVTFTALALSSTSVTLAADQLYFERVATYPVYKTLEESAQLDTKTSAEIIAATDDEKTLVFTDSPAHALVFLGIDDIYQPSPKGRVALSGEPTSVAVAGGYAYVGVNTSQSYTQPSGHLAIVDVKTLAITGQCDLGGQPDSVALSPDRKFLTVAIENERDEDLNEGVIPQAPAGYLASFDLDTNGQLQNCDSVRRTSLSGLAHVAPSDPEAEFVSINNDNTVVVTLQENNHLALVDLKTGRVQNHFPAGHASAMNIPVRKAKMSDASGSINSIAREPDAVAWIDDERFVTANEGDYKGGSRGFTIWNKKGDVLFDSGGSMEHLAMSYGHYPAKRAHKKGVEPEGVATGKFGEQTYIFVNSERGNFVAVYKDTGSTPEFVQFLPTHIAPEGLLALPKRGLFVVANEGESLEDNVRSHLSLYQFGAKTPFYPHLVSDMDDRTNAPIGWGALSGLTASKQDPNILYAVSDSFYDEARILKIDRSHSPAKIIEYITLPSPADLDLEGIALSTNGGFWLASEGNAKDRPPLLLEVASDGSILKEVQLPQSLLEVQSSYSLEGVAEFSYNGQTKVAVAFQREWKDDQKGLVKLGFYTLEDNSWAFAHYPLDTPASKAGGWVGLSEIISLGNNRLALLERDNKGGQAAAIKQITTVSLDGIDLMPHGQKLPVLKKNVVVDLLPALSRSNGWTPDKVEGMARTIDGAVIIITDNDGVDDASGETQFINLGPADQLGLK